MKKLQIHNKLRSVLLIALVAMTVVMLTSCPSTVTNHVPTFTVDLPSTSSVQAGSNLNLSVTIADLDKDEISYTWEKSSDNGTNWIGVGTNSSSYVFSETVAGTYKVKMTGDDGKGGLITSNTCAITVTTITTPSVILVDLGGPYTEPANFNIDANVEKVEKTVSEVNAYVGATTIGELKHQSGTLYRYSATNVPAGNYLLKVVVEFTDATTIESSTKLVTVNAAAVNRTVTFESNGGSTVSPITIESGSKITAPITPTKAGFTFDNWYKEAALLTLWDFANDVVTSNITLYAKWTPIVVHSLVYKNGGDNKLYRLLAETDTEITDLDAGRTVIMLTYDGISLVYKNGGDNKLYRLLAGTDTEVTGLDAGKYIAMLVYDGTSLIYQNSGDNKLYRLLAGTDTEVTGLDAGKYIAMLVYDGTSLIYQNSGDNKLYRLLAGTDTEVTGLDAGKYIAMLVYDGTSLIYQNSGDNKLYRLLAGTDTEVTGLDAGRTVIMLIYY